MSYSIDTVTRLAPVSYERGAHRVSASMLFEIAEALDCAIGDFFQGLETKSPGRSDGGVLGAVLSTESGFDLLANFPKVPPAVQSEMAALAKLLAAPTDGVPGGDGSSMDPKERSNFR